MRVAFVVVGGCLMGGCASWVVEDDVWFDAPDQPHAVDPLYGYSADEEPVEVLEELHVAPPPEAPPEAFLFGEWRGRVHRCTWRVRRPEPEPIVGSHIIRRIVDRHRNEVRICYNRALRRDPTLRGRVSMQFVIAADGTVPAAAAQDSGIADARLKVCLARAIKRWKFPVPVGAGPAVVNYPFVFSVPQNQPDGSHCAAVRRRPPSIASVCRH